MSVESDDVASLYVGQDSCEALAFAGTCFLCRQGCMGIISRTVGVSTRRLPANIIVPYPRTETVAAQWGEESEKSRESGAGLDVSR